MTNTPKALRAGLIGAHISRSRLRDALSMMCDGNGIEFEFSLIDSAENAEFDFVETVTACRSAGWNGVTVTHPWKPAAAEFAGDGMRADVRALGAANTLVFGPPLAGYNTDFTGFLSAWNAEFGQAKPGRVAMAGAGGVARALGPALRDLKARDIAIWDTDAGRAAELAAQIGKPARTLDQSEILSTIEAADGLVNATPLGMANYPGCAFPIPLPAKPAWAFDAVYTPVNTAFLQAARDNGARVLTGFDLFRHMALLSFTAYTGIAPNPEQTLRQLLPLQPD